MRFTLRTLLLLVLAAAVVFAVRIPIEATIALLLLGCLALSIAYWKRRGRSLGAVIAILYSVVGLLLLGCWCAGVRYFVYGPPG